MGARHSRATWTSQVLLADVSGVFPGYSRFRPTYMYRSIRLNTSEKELNKITFVKVWQVSLSEVDTSDLSTYCTKCEELL